VASAVETPPAARLLRYKRVAVAAPVSEFAQPAGGLRVVYGMA
jgi:hypothetical protein